MTISVDREDLVEGLLRPEAYPWHPPAVELIETHISWVFLAGDRVVKVKRPVVYPFVDHRSLSRRAQSCHDEVRLNRRLTEGVYLGVVPIVRADASYRVAAADNPSAASQAIEWATLMRRLPAAGMLDGLLRAGTAPADLAPRLAARLIPFHREATRCSGETDAVAAAMTDIVTDNLDELTPFASAPLGATQLRLVTAAMRRFVAAHGALLRARVASGWIREGHGDLRAEHVCLEPGGVVQIFDCVEFNRAVRCADVASDLVYLLMDLTQLGAGAVTADLLTRYRAAGFALPDDLLRYYGTHRALVRTKIACLALTGEDAPHDAALAATAANYLAMASAASLTVRPTLFVMTGLSGTGKSTVATALARALGVNRIATDAVRKELAGQLGLATARWGEGLYAPERTEATYRELFARAERALAGGAPVILDGAFLDERWREQAAIVARSRGAPLVLIETICDEDVVMRRLAAREAHPGSLSDATRDTYRYQREAIAAAPPAIPPGAISVQIDTTPETTVDLEPVFAALHREGLVAATIPSTAWLGRERTPW